MIVMLKIARVQFTTTLTVALLLGLAGVFSMTGCKVRYRSTFQSGSMEMIVHQIEPTISGTWTATFENGWRSQAGNVWVPITVRDGNESVQRTIGRPAEELSRLFEPDSESWPGAVELTSEAGEIRLESRSESDRAGGQFTVKPNAAFADRVSGSLAAPPEGVDWIWLILQEISSEEIAAFAETGTRLTVNEICRVKAHGISADYFSAVRRASDFSVSDVIRLRNHGVPADFPEKLQEAGYEFEAKDLTRLRNFGVSADEAAGWKKAGFDCDASELTKFRSFGVKPEFGGAVRATLKDPAPDDIIKLRNFGITVPYLENMKKAGADFSADDLVHLRNFGVQPDYVAAWRNAGFGFGAKEIAKLRSFGVPTEYASAVGIPGRKPLSSDAIIKLRQRGLSAEEIRELRE